ncbi:hypothetical protein HDU92_001354 [Lobulomyces angularis]|nr:hypothetical protein HDU92_001354 [Lobulomyces angularis]
MRSVIVTGSFDNWAKTVAMNYIGDHLFTANLTRLENGSKLLFKFVVDGKWTVANEYPTESDGQGNFNNTLIVSDRENENLTENKILKETSPLVDSFTPSTEGLSTCNLSAEKKEVNDDKVISKKDEMKEILKNVEGIKSAEVTQSDDSVKQPNKLLNKDSTKTLNKDNEVVEEKPKFFQKLTLKKSNRNLGAKKNLDANHVNKVENGEVLLVNNVEEHSDEKNGKRTGKSGPFWKNIFKKNKGEDLLNENN